MLILQALKRIHRCKSVNQGFGCAPTLCAHGEIRLWKHHTYAESLNIKTKLLSLVVTLLHRLPVIYVHVSSLQL